jgi:CBS domain-containing protein
MPDEPLQELWVALAGPAVNVVIAAALFLWVWLTAGVHAARAAWHRGWTVPGATAAVNVILVAFNMLPAFPMDGGRVLRALLATRLEYTRATQIAATIGQGMALLFGLLGFFFNPFLLFIALFVWIGAAQEASMVQMTAALDGIPVARAMQTSFEALAPDDTLARAVDHVLAGSQQDFPVVVNGQVVGILTRRDLLAALARRGREAAVRDVMQTDFRAVEVSDMLERAFRRMQGCACHTLPVVADGRLVGLVTMDNIGEFLMIQAAERGRKRSRPPVESHSHVSVERG